MHENWPPHLNDSTVIMQFDTFINDDFNRVYTTNWVNQWCLSLEEYICQYLWQSYEEILKLDFSFICSEWPWIFQYDLERPWSPSLCLNKRYQHHQFLMRGLGDIRSDGHNSDSMLPWNLFCSLVFCVLSFVDGSVVSFLTTLSHLQFPSCWSICLQIYACVIITLIGLLLDGFIFNKQQQYKKSTCLDLQRMQTLPDSKHFVNTCLQTLLIY
jgi:hypothetical protein